jgi:ABC-type branched-subunit amino acid transport system substrate-binding protein
MPTLCCIKKTYMTKNLMLTSIARRSLILGSVALAAPLSFAQSRKIVLGQSAPLTGPSAQLGIQFNLGAQLYFDQLNSSGGVGGRKIELRVLDDGYEPDRTVVNTKQFIDEGVFALFGYIGTPTSVAALPLASAAKIPFFAPFTGAEVLRTPFNRYAIHVRASYNDETQAMVQRSINIGVKKIAVFYQNDAFGQAGLVGVTSALAKEGLSPVASGVVERNSVDVAAAVKTIVAARPDVVVMVSTYKPCAAFVRAARVAGYTGTFQSVSFVGTTALSSELGKDASGVVVSQVMPYPYSIATPISAEYLSLVKVANKPEIFPNYSSMEGFVAAKVFQEALKKSGATASREAFIDALETIKSQNFGGFYVDFAKNKHVASKFVELTLLSGDGKVMH